MTQQSSQSGMTDDEKSKAYATSWFTGLAVVAGLYSIAVILFIL